MTISGRDIIALRPEGLYCAAGDFYIDPWRHVDTAVITHGHGDHARIGMGRYHAATDGMPVLRWRLGEQTYHPHAYGEPFEGRQGFVRKTAESALTP